MRILIREETTSKTRSINLNEKARAIVHARHKANPEHIYLFQVDSNRGKGKRVLRVVVAAALKAVGEELGIKLGMQSMRKTRG